MFRMVTVIWNMLELSGGENFHIVHVPFFLFQDDDIVINRMYLIPSSEILGCSELLFRIEV